MTERPDEPEQPDISPLSPRATRIFVIIAIIAIVGGAIALAWVLVEGASDPETQRRLEELQELEEQPDPDEASSQRLELEKPATSGAAQAAAARS